MPRKTAQLQIRVTPAAKARLRREAAAAGVDVSTLVLQRALPDPHTAFARLVDVAVGAHAPAYALAAIHDLLDEVFVGMLQGMRFLIARDFQLLTIHGFRAAGAIFSVTPGAVLLKGRPRDGKLVRRNVRLCGR